MNISFVIPCYNSENTIEDVIKEIIEVMGQREHNSYEIICVNDHSPDSVYTVLKRIAFSNKNVKVVNFARNFGKASAVLAGLNKCNGDVIVLLDDDGQCPVCDTWKLIDKLSDEIDISMADYPVKQENWWKRAGSIFNEKMMRFLITHPENIRVNNFSAMKSFVAKEMIRYNNPYPSLQPLIVQTTHDIAMVSMEERERTDNKASGFTFIKSFKLMINGFTNFSVKPLRVASFLGMVVAIIGFIYGIVLVVKQIGRAHV